jgi:DNA-binding protein Fis
MEILNLPPLAIEPASSPNTQTLPENCPVQDAANQNVATSRANPHAAILPPDRLLKQMEFGLEGVAEKLLRSTVGDDDNLLASMHEIMERLFIRSALRVTEGNISRAAKLLGINRNTLSKKLRVFDGRS